MIDFSALYGNALAMTGTPNSAQATDTEYKGAPRFYLRSNEDNYIRAVPYIDSTGMPQLFRRVTFHRIPYTWVNQNQVVQEDVKTILCEATAHGQRCRFCDLAYKLKSAGDQLWYKYARTTDYLLLGTRVVMDANYNYVPAELDEAGVVKMGAIFLSGISKQTHAFDEFLQSKLVTLPADIPELRGLAAHDILGRIFDYNKGLVLKITSTKQGKFWVGNIEVKNVSMQLPSTTINLEKDYLNPELYKVENINRTYESFAKFVVNRIGGGFPDVGTNTVGYASSTPTAPPTFQMPAPNSGAVPFLQGDRFDAVGVGGVPPSPPSITGARYNEPVGAAHISEEDENIFTRF